MALQEVTVTSHHAQTFTDKHHGIEFTFEPNKQVLIPKAAAVHFFGVGLPADAPARMMAWKRRGFTDSVKGEAFLKKFETKIVDLIPEGSDLEEIKEGHAKTVEELKAEHEKVLGDLEAEHREEVQRINKLHAAEVTALKTRIDELEGRSAAGTKTAKKA